EDAAERLQQVGLRIGVEAVVPGRAEAETAVRQLVRNERVQVGDGAPAAAGEPLLQLAPRPHVSPDQLDGRLGQRHHVASSSLTQTSFFAARTASRSTWKKVAFLPPSSRTSVVTRPSSRRCPAASLMSSSFSPSSSASSLFLTTTRTSPSTVRW